MAGFERARSWFINHDRQPSQAAEDDLERTVARWVNKQRRASNGTTHHQISPERRGLIDSLPGWEWDPREARWHASFRHYANWVSTHGRVPLDSRGREEYVLASWASGQRQAAFGTGTTRLTQERIELLESTPGWFWRAGWSNRKLPDPT